MCGIAGYYSTDSSLNQAHLKVMTDAIEHRGPDSDGFYHDSMVGLGHRRLSIIDLRQIANQPMFSHDNRYVIIYNGEVYNFRELSAQVRVNNDGFFYKTNSDTEVILEAFCKWGVDFVQRLNGMFAFAIYDTVDHHLFLYRDRIGIKPLFYFWDGTNLLFASEMKALLKIEQVRQKLSIDMEAVNTFLHLGYIPADHTIYNEIKKFPAGSKLHVGPGIFSMESYWKVEDKVEFDSFNNFGEARKKLRYLIETSVQYRMISDVPFGTFLSGGIDSSLVTAVAQSLSSKPVKTFSIGFKEAKFNEAEHAAAVAKQIGTEHHEFMVSTKEAQDLLESIFTSYDEPYTDSSAIPTMLVSKMARKHVTMTLSGDGGDELFLGYGAYKWAERFESGWFRYYRKPMRYAFSKMKARYQRVSRLIDIDDIQIRKSHIFSQEQGFFSRAEIKKLMKSDNLRSIELDESYDKLRRPLETMEAQAFFDLKYYLPDDLLVKVDRASMKYSLETRVPLLDYRIIEFALNLPESFKFQKNTSKYILKSILYDYVPKQFFDRPKWGFSIPLNQWLKTDMYYLVEEYLSPKSVNDAGLMNYTYVKELIDRWMGKEEYLYNRIWTLIILHKWMREYKISNAIL
jgi:asparagine synthase (glutamine-hydrolysing)